MTADDETPSAAHEDRITDDPPQHSPLWRRLSAWLLRLEAWLRSHGGEPLRFGIRAFWGLVGAAGLFLLVGPVINPPLTLEDITSSAETANEQWIARDFSVEYTVDLADDGSLVAQVEERITAFFPDDVDQSGIERVLVTDFQGQSLRPDTISATLDGTPLDIEQDAEPTLLTLTMDAGERLQGDHEFVIRYALYDLAFVTEDRATGTTVDLLEWDVLGPGWSTAIAGLDVRVTLANELNDELVRDPRGIVLWTLLSDGTWLEPEETSPAGFTSYAFSNDQNLPPYANAIFTFVFEPGSIVMPEPSTWFWVQTFGPLVPLVFLVVTLLLAVAARRVAWSDERGRPWYVAQSEPPHGLPVRLAAHLLRSPRTLELADALQELPRGGAARKDELLAAGGVAKRAGRLGDLPRALSRYALGSERKEQLTRELRRIPRGFVRDAFIAAPIALTLVQWSVVRQLSYQTTLSVVWWPVAFVLASTIISVVVIAIALSARPLTEAGALLKQHLLGVGVYSERTRLLERGTLDDAVIPYAVLTTPPREAGASIVAVIEAELGEPIPRRSWLTADYLTLPRLLVRALALVLVAGSIAIAALIPNPFNDYHRYLSYTWDVPGSGWTYVEGFSASAELSRDADGHAVIEASETVTVVFEEGGSLPPQLVRQWRNVVDGQDLDVSIQRVLLDGSPVPYTTEQDFDSLALRTTMTESIFGEYDVQIDYTIGSAAVAADAYPSRDVVDRVWWTALLRGWKYDYGGEDSLLEPLQLEFRVSDELAAEAIQSGWITVDPSTGMRADEWPATVIPFGEVRNEPDSDATDESATVDDGVLVKSLEIGHTEIEAYPWSITIRDLGTMLDFPAGTFTGPDENALRETQFATTWPTVLTVLMGLLGFALGGVALLVTIRRSMAPVASGVARDLLRWLAPALALATFIQFVWVSTDVAANHPVVGPTGWAAVAAIVGAGVSLWLGWRRGGAKIRTS